MSSGAGAGADRLSWILLILLGVIWGASFLAVELALPSFGPMTLAACRIALAAAILVPLALVLGRGLPDLGTARGRRVWLHCAAMGLFSNAIPFSLLSWGQLQVTSGFAGITMAAVPLLVLPLSHWLVPGERMTGRKAAGFAIGFAGVLTLLGWDAVAEALSGADAGLARLACVAGSCCYAVGSIATRLAPPTDPLSFAAGALMVATAAIWPVALLTESAPSLAMSAASLGGVLYLGVAATAAATVLLVAVVTRAGPPFLSQVNYMVPCWAVALGAVMLNEEVQLRFGLALALILAGVFMAQTGRARAPVVPG